MRKLHLVTLGGMSVGDGQSYVVEPVSTSSRYTQMVALTVLKMMCVLMKKPGPVWYLRQAEV